MTTLDRNRILESKDCTYHAFDVPEWGGTLHIKSMSGSERDAFRSAIADAPAGAVGRFTAALLVLTLVDEGGVKLFELHDIDALAAKSAAVLDRVVQEAMRINGMAEQSAEVATKN
jgi:hypothetical protein